MNAARTLFIFAPAALGLAAICAPALAGPMPLSYADAVLSSNPIAYYRFSETSGVTAADEIGGNDGTYVGAPNQTAPGPRPSDFQGFEPGNVGTGFDRATSDAVTTPVSLSGLGAFTLEGWVKASTTSQGNRTGLFGQNNAIELGYINDSTIQLWTPVSGQNNVSAPADDSWFHLAGIGTGSETQIYIDGVLVGIDTHGPLGASGYGANGFLTNIGGAGVFDATGNYFLGDLDEVAFYDRALSADEVLAHYEAGVMGRVPVPGTAALGLLGLAALFARRRRSS